VEVNGGSALADGPVSSPPVQHERLLKLNLKSGGHLRQFSASSKMTDLFA